MVKVLENRAVDLDIVPGSKDGAELKEQADAVTYVGTLSTHLPSSAIYFTRTNDRMMADGSSIPTAAKRPRISRLKPASASRASRRGLRASARMRCRRLVGA